VYLLSACSVGYSSTLNMGSDRFLRNRQDIRCLAPDSNRAPPRCEKHYRWRHHARWLCCYWLCNGSFKNVSFKAFRIRSNQRCVWLRGTERRLNTTCWELHSTCGDPQLTGLFLVLLLRARVVFIMKGGGDVRCIPERMNLMRTVLPSCFSQ
jgi:hypothetical protein